MEIPERFKNDKRDYVVYFEVRRPALLIGYTFDDANAKADELAKDSRASGDPLAVDDKPHHLMAVPTIEEAMRLVITSSVGEQVLNLLDKKEAELAEAEASHLKPGDFN